MTESRDTHAAESLPEPRRTGRIRAACAVARSTGWLGVLAVFLVVTPFAGVGVLAATRATWLPWFAPPDATAVASFVVSTVVLCGLSLIPTYAVAVAAGYLFGAVAGSVWAVVVITGAAWFGRAILAPLVGDRVVDRILARPRARAAYAVLLGSEAGTATTLVTLVRLAPVTPFAGTNLLMVAAKVALVPFLVGTAIGLGPRTVLVAVAGAGLAELQFDAAGGAAALWATLGCLVVAVVGLGVLARRRFREIAAVAARAEPPSDRCGEPAADRW